MGLNHSLTLWNKAQRPLVPAPPPQHTHIYIYNYGDDMK